MIDNLIAQKKIPVMICVFINPGDISGSEGTPTYNFVKAYSEKWKRSLKDSMRSTLYDTVSERYARYLRDEILSEVAAQIQHSQGSRTAARSPDFRPAVSVRSTRHGRRQTSSAASFPGLVVSRASSGKKIPRIPDGGQDYPDKILREPKRNIRVWLQDGSEDLDLRYGNWPFANLRMANALKFQGYDFHFSFGGGTHNAAHGAAEFPAEMIWLWRDYDPSKSAQTYEMDPSEKVGSTVSRKDAESSDLERPKTVRQFLPSF